MLKSKGILILTAAITFALVLGIGYFFAKMKTEPQYDSKIDKVMYDKKNKSPKYVMTLPDHKEIKNIEKINEAVEDKVEEAKVVEAGDVLIKIPLVSRMEPIADIKPLSIIDAESDLIKKIDDGLIPQIGEDGKKPWSKYGRQIDVQPNFYKVAIVINNVGLDALNSKAAIESLPSYISLSFSPYSNDLEKQIKTARKSGHETYVDLLLSSRDYLKSDTGPLAMNLSSKIEDNLKKLRKSLNVNAPIGGMTIARGMFDIEDKTRIQKVMSEIEGMGLLAFDATDENDLDTIKTKNLARKKADIVIDTSFTRENIDKQLAKAEIIARNNGSVLIVANAKPVVLYAILEWVQTFSPQITEYEQIKDAVIAKPLALVPASNLVAE